jgi:hypothetical protein
VSVRQSPGARDPVIHESRGQRPGGVHDERLARRHVLERAYPLAKQLAEILELEDVELGEDAKRIRRAIGQELARLGRDGS